MSMYVPAPKVPEDVQGRSAQPAASSLPQGGSSTNKQRIPLWSWRSIEQKVHDAREDSVNDAGAIEILRSEGVADPEAALARYSFQRPISVRAPTYDHKRVRYLAATRLRLEIKEGTLWEKSNIKRALKKEDLWEVLRNHYALEDSGFMSYHWDRTVLAALERYIDDPSRVPADLAGPTSAKPLTADDAAAMRQRDELARRRADEAELGEILTGSFFGAVSYGVGRIFTDDPHELLEAARFGAAAEGVIGALGGAAQNRGTYSPEVVGPGEYGNPYGPWRYRGPAPTKAADPVSPRGTPSTVAPPSRQLEAGPSTVAPPSRQLGAGPSTVAPPSRQLGAGPSTVAPPQMTGKAPQIAMGDVKTLTANSYRANLKHISEMEGRGIYNTNGNIGMAMYDPKTGDVTLQVFGPAAPGQPRKIIWEGPIGKVQIPPGRTPVQIGNDVEEPVRDLVRKATGQPFPYKRSNAPGPDLRTP